MAAQTDLWGDIQTEKIRTPVSILREQAALLGPKTQNIVEAKVDTRSERGDFYHYFTLVVPALDNYKYNLFAISHDIRLYPVLVQSEGTQLTNEQTFTEWLGRKLTSAETRKLISSLIAQATQAT
jgi:hypothetical protein